MELQLGKYQESMKSGLMLRNKSLGSKVQSTKDSLQERKLKHLLGQLVLAPVRKRLRINPKGPRSLQQSELG